MIDLTDCIALGTITKTHGIHGQVVLFLDQLSVNDIQKMEPIFIEMDGLPVPFFIADYEEKSSNTIILTFDELTTGILPKDLIDCKVFIHRSGLKSGEKIPPLDESIVRFTVLDEKSGPLGVVVEILSIAQNPLIKIMQGSKEILLPLQPDFIIKVDSHSKILYVHVPDGLIDLS
jgi:16S rRNA processing protein RimM